MSDERNDEMCTIVRRLPPEEGETAAAFRARGGAVTPRVHDDAVVVKVHGEWGRDGWIAEWSALDPLPPVEPPAAA